MLYFFFSLFIDIYFLIPAVIAQIFNPIAEVTIPIGIPTKEVKEEIETHPVTTKAQINKCSIYFKAFQTFFAFYSTIHFIISSIIS